MSILQVHFCEECFWPQSVLTVSFWNVIENFTNSLLGVNFLCLLLVLSGRKFTPGPSFVVPFSQLPSKWWSVYANRVSSSRAFPAKSRFVDWSGKYYIECFVTYKHFLFFLAMRWFRNSLDLENSSFSWKTAILPISILRNMFLLTKYYCANTRGFLFIKTVHSY